MSDESSARYQRVKVVYLSNYSSQSVRLIPKLTVAILKIYLTIRRVIVNTSSLLFDCRVTQKTRVTYVFFFFRIQTININRSTFVLRTNNRRNDSDL